MECFSTPAHLLYLATLAGAEALALGEETGDFRAGKAADFVYLRPPADSPLAAVLERRAESGADCWPRSSRWLARRACAKFASQGPLFIVRRRGGAMTIDELNLLDSAQLRRGPRLGLRRFAVGGRAGLRCPAVRQFGRSARGHDGASGARDVCRRALALLRRIPISAHARD